MNSEHLGARILIVDDEALTRNTTRAFLDKHGYAVTAVDSAEAAFSLLNDGYVPDLVMLDVIMPGIDGFETCRMLRHQPKFSHLPVIMLTALDDRESIDQAYRCGATDFITKPLNYPLLRHRMQYMLRSASVLRHLYESQEALVNTQHIALLGNWTMDAAGDIVAASRQYLDIIGAATPPVPENRLFERVHREDRELLATCRRQLATGRAYRLDYRLQAIGRDNIWLHVHERGFPFFDVRGNYQGANGFTQDITERVVQEERIRDLAWHDRVTGLNNRDRLLELIDRELNADRPGHRMSLLYVYVESLREIATVFGQGAADAAMREFAGRLQALLGNPLADGASALARAAKFGRYDEHSLVVVLPGDDCDEVSCIAEQLHAALTRPVVLPGEDLLARAHIGIARYPEDATDGTELIRRARLVALHAASGDGDVIRFFDPDHEREAARRVAIERGLRAAMEQGGQLRPYFQPKVSAATGEMVGAEVLLRWTHPELGAVPPAQFIPVAEDSGLIHAISEWLIDEVCSLIGAWQHEREVGNISVNLSAQSFFQRTLLEFIDEVLARTGVPPARLTIELTESVLMQDADAAAEVIAGLRRRGLRVSLDDFGTGFSSLGYLNSFRIDEIKIDRSFVNRLVDDATGRALVQAIISLGHALGLEVVAEGVETPEQALLLGQMGCDLLQGFLYARPMPAGEFAAFRCPAVAVGSAG